MTTQSTRARPAGGARMLDAVWLTLMALTLATAWLAETADPALWATLLVALSVGIKGQLVVDRFMELRLAHPYIRFAMNLYFYLLPVVIVLVFMFPEALARLTTLPR